MINKLFFLATNHSVCINFCPQSVSQSATQVVSQSASQSGSQSISQSVSQSASQLVSKSMILVKNGLEVVFDDYLVRKEVVLDYKHIDVKQLSLIHI